MVRSRSDGHYLTLSRLLQPKATRLLSASVERCALEAATGANYRPTAAELHRMFEHWLRCYGIFEEDKKYLKHVYELRYEDYIENPGKYHQEIAAFIGTRVPEAPDEDKFRHVTQWPNPMGLRVSDRAMEETSRAYNKKYFDRWSDLLNNSLFKSYYRYIAVKYEPRVAKYGYSLTKDLGVSEEVLQGAKISNAVGALCCLGADTGAFMRRLSVRSNTQLRVTAKAVLPEFVVTRIRQARQKNEMSEAGTQKTEGRKTSNADSRSPDRSPLPGRQCSPSGGFPERRIQRPASNAE
jgi:hypothetical protein